MILADIISAVACMLFLTMMNYSIFTCNANSLVGDNIRALKFFPCDGLLAGVMSFSSIGRTKQAVLPEPVRAIATTSLFSNAIGIV